MNAQEMMRDDVNDIESQMKEEERVTVYANPITGVGLAEEAEILEVLRETKTLKYCRVRMIETGRECNVFIKK
jgi:hypothetical protein